MKTKKPTQLQQITEYIDHAGFVTNDIIMRKLFINNPFARIMELKTDINLKDMRVRTLSGKYIKVFYTSKKAALGYVKRIGGRVA